MAILQAAFGASARTASFFPPSAGLSGTAMALSDARETMQVKKLSSNAIMPVKGSEHAAGFDLARCEWTQYVDVLLCCSLKKVFFFLCGGTTIVSIIAS